MLYAAPSDYASAHAARDILGADVQVSTTFDVVYGDCLREMPKLAADSVDAIVTDPPYGLKFMGKEWDHGVPGKEFWIEALRVAKPGAHLVAFGGTRTFHRLAVAVEDAGWEIRDSLSWLYGSGFPKSLDISKAIDKARDDKSDARVICRVLRAAMETQGKTAQEIAAHFKFNPRMAEHWAARETDSQPTVPTWEQWRELKTLLSVGDDLDTEVWRLNGRKGKPGDAWLAAEVVGVHEGEAGGLGGERFNVRDNLMRAPATDAARQWEGWGTALKPAWEPIILARKPFKGTVASNVQEHGTGALNIDACRIGFASDADREKAHENALGPVERFKTSHKIYEGGKDSAGFADTHDARGRWPANVVLDEEAAAMLDQQTGISKAGTAVQRNGGGQRIGSERTLSNYDGDLVRPDATYGDAGGASRFFYTAKASRSEREEGLDQFRKAPGGSNAKGYTEDVARGLDRNRPVANNHPTVKPLDLMRWLCRLVTPPGGTILDPFTGSGSTGCAALMEGFSFIGIELEKESADLARARIAHHGRQLTLGVL